MARIVRSDESEKDIIEIGTYIAQDNLDAALRLLDTFDEKLHLLSEFPGLGERRDELATGILSFPIGNYLLFYRKKDDGIELLRVLHGARNLRRLFSRHRSS